MQRETAELKATREQIAQDTKAFLKAGGKIQSLGNGITDYAKSGMHQYNNQARRDAARARRV